MRDALERIYRFVLPGVLLLVFVAPLLWLRVWSIILDPKLISILGGWVLGHGALYHVVQKQFVERVIDRAWKIPCRHNWDDELADWPATSWLLPGARLGYRLRRMRFLIERSEQYSPLLQLLSVGQARGYVDVSSYTENPELKHKVRLAYVYTELGIVLNGFVAAALYIGNSIEFWLGGRSVATILAVASYED